MWFKSSKLCSTTYVVIDSFLSTVIYRDDISDKHVYFLPLLCNNHVLCFTLIQVALLTSKVTVVYIQVFTLNLYQIVEYIDQKPTFVTK